MARTLEDRLDAIRTGFEESAPAEALTVMHRATDALAASGQAERARGEGDAAPAFSLANPSGEQRTLADFLPRGPLVLTFFRGFW